MIAVLVDHPGGVPSQSTLEILTLARGLDAPVAVWVGTPPSAEAVATLGLYGSSEVRVADVPHDTPVAGLAAAVEAAAGDAALLLAVSSFAAKEVLTRVAIATGAAIVVDANGLEKAGDGFETTQAVFTATWLVRTRLERPRAVVALRPNSTRARPLDVPAGASVTPVAVTLPAPRERIVSRADVPATGVPLSEASVVVAGGRGTGGDFSLIEELARLLGGAVGATRDATDEGWLPHEAMSGQTGGTGTPALYVGCGISGAVYHRGGMQGAGIIVAINSDESAPIFDIADFGIVGDMFEVVPQAIAALKERAT